jgi:hypothetical protein
MGNTKSREQIPRKYEVRKSKILLQYTYIIAHRVYHKYKYKQYNWIKI